MKEQDKEYQNQWEHAHRDFNFQMSEANKSTFKNEETTELTKDDILDAVLGIIFLVSSATGIILVLFFNKA